MSHRPQPAPILHPASRGVHPRDLEPRRGLTLIEMLVALAVTLVMMAAVVNLFANISGSIRNRRAVIEVSGQLRQVRSRLALDLAGATCPGTTWQRPDYDLGYIEIIEGDRSDAYPSVLVDGDTANGEIDYTTSLVPSGGDPAMNLAAVTPPLTTRAPQSGDVTNGRALGDWDDILALTVRSESEPFVTFDGALRIESNLAEVVWFAGENTPGIDPGEPGMRRIYRNVFLISPGRTWNGGPNSRPPIAISMHHDGTRWVSNTLGDLTKREYRAAREFDPTDDESLFPHPLEDDELIRTPQFLVLESALAFDVRLYDPGAPLYQVTPGTVVQPGDPGWFSAVGGTPVGYGAYCDLGWAWERVVGTLAYPPALPLPTGVPAPMFNTLRQVGWHPMMTTANTALRDYPCVYDTWSYHYENDGIGQENVLVDVYSRIEPPLPGPERPQFLAWQMDTLNQGANDLDDDNVNGVDDLGERETAPPYDAPLRGIKVSLRIYERDARQIRETSVTHAFAK